MFLSTSEGNATLTTTTKTMETKTITNVMAKMTQKEFWNLQEVKDQQDIQKKNPFRSQPHVDAFYEIKRLLAYNISVEFAEDYMGEYE